MMETCPVSIIVAEKGWQNSRRNAIAMSVGEPENL